MRKLLSRLTLMLTVAALTSCALITADTAAATAVNQGVELVTTIYIQHHAGPTLASEYAFAQQVKAIATTLQGVITGNLTITQFNAAAAAAVAKLSTPVERQIAGDLLTQLDLFFAAQVANKGSLLNASITAAASLVFGDIITATAAFAPASTSLKP
jgi:hypothetical protein